MSLAGSPMAAYGFEGSFKTSLLVIVRWGSPGPICSSTSKIKSLCPTKSRTSWYLPSKDEIKNSSTENEGYLSNQPA